MIRSPHLLGTLLLGLVAGLAACSGATPVAAPAVSTGSAAACAVPDRFRGVAPIRRTLNATGVPATFFLTGQWVQR